MNIYEVFPRTVLAVDALEPGRVYRSTIDHVEQRDGPAGPRVVLVLGTPVQGFKEMYLNRTSAYRLAQVLGPETDRWVGRSVLIARKKFYGKEGILVVPDNTQNKGGQR